MIRPRWGARLGILALLGLGCSSSSSPGSGDRAFVSETANGSLAVVDIDAGVVERRIEVGLLPHNIVLSPDRRTLYVVLAGSQSIAVVDTVAGSLLRTFLTAPVPRTRSDGSVIQPHLDQGAFSHTTCYDCHRDGGAQPRYVGGRPVALRLSPDGTRLYVAHVTTGELVVLDAASGARLAATMLAPVGPVKEPTAIDLLGPDLYVTLRATQPSSTAGIVRRLDPATLAALGDNPSGSDPVDLRALPARGVALVTRFDSNLVSVVDGTGESATLTVANGPLGLTPLPDGRVLVLGYYSNAVSLVDLATGSVDTYPLVQDGVALANPTHAAVGSDPGVAWVVSSGTDARLAALDLSTRRVVRAIPVNGLSYDVAIVPGAVLRK